ncbi:DUF2244 domain-containing protein [Sphingoaurantiacus capsulatus]|uniref:DUF2244 domain-containing protein n=1 Tax=Sphingoaurantiacus capsulatus TaxID=1771310 RepID=A0ABV7XEA3_9SPHN
MTAAPYFDLVLTPNRSLDRRHARWIVLGVGAIMGLMALRMLWLGAWPVVPFLILDVALVVWAFRASYRSGRGFETLRLDADDLVVRRTSPEGHERRIRLEPLWTRATLERLAMKQNRLWLVARDTRVSVGRFLSPAEREAIYEVIADGLERFRRRG